MSFLWLGPVSPSLPLPLADSLSAAPAVSFPHYLYLHPLLLLLLLCWYFVNLMAPRVLRERERGRVLLANCPCLCLLLLLPCSCSTCRLCPVLLIGSCVLRAPCSLSCSRSRENLSLPTRSSRGSSNRIKDKRFMCVRVRACFNEPHTHAGQERARRRGAGRGSTSLFVCCVICNLAKLLLTSSRTAFLFGQTY